MFSFFKRSQTKPNAPAEGTCVVAVGDIHGQLDKLQKLINEINALEVACDHRELVFLGDYVDRGPQSAQVLDFLTENAFLADWHKTFLMGNHEQIMLQALHDLDYEMWLKWGGRETLQSYQISSAHSDREQVEKLRENLPAAHQSFLENLDYSYTSGDYFFVHAGINPSRPLDQQSNHDLLWSRQPFLKSKKPFEKVIVHGHTPVPTPEHHPNRIAIDTGCARGGDLSAVVLNGTDVSFITV